MGCFLCGADGELIRLPAPCKYAGRWVCPKCLDGAIFGALNHVANQWYLQNAVDEREEDK